MAGELRLEVHDFRSPERWRWTLRDAGGAFLADHEVRLDAGDWRFTAFSDLGRYLRWNAAPDRRIEAEAELVAQVGDWIGAEVFGPVGPALIKARPSAVRVVLPPEARVLAFRPLELARVDGTPLALRNIPLVMCDGAAEPGAKEPVGERLRVLGLFSLPTGGGVLNLRRERHAMSTLFSELGAVRGRAVEMRVLQYGVTRERLAEILKDGEGWDVVHVSGHGNPGELLLEHPDGSPDPVPAADFVDLLEPTAERLKLVTVSACSSAALKAADQLRALGVTPPAGWSGSASPGPVSPESVSAEHALSTLATDLADRLDCAVLAMRYPVVDSFAIDLAAELYGLLVEKGRPLPRALGMALRAVVAAPPTLDCPALSVTTPALFGARALELKLTAPEGEPVTFRPGSLKLAGLPPQPPRFVGRTKAITDASAALAPRSGAAGVLLYGMPGAGKTACALELAYTHAESFRIVAWHKAPDEGTDTTGAFTAFLTDLERKISGLELVHLAENEEALRAFLPLLTEFFERNRVLVVLDNAESLLTSDGGWRDRRWGPVVDALTGHGGFSRLVVTSRVRPAALEGRVEQIAIDALPAAEALLLARELPGLRALMDGRTRGVEPSDARELAVRAVKMAHGHPKLLELADGQAADSGRLRGLLEAGGAAWRETAGGLPEDFFTVVDRAAGVSGEDYLRVLERWTQVVAGGLSAAERDLFGFVCCLEEDDRLGFVLEAVWPVLWRRLGREGAVPEPEAVLGVLVRRGLASPEAGGRLGVHPGVATAGRAAAGQVFRAAVDAELAAFWQAIFDQAVEGQGGQELGEWVVRAGLGAVPYLLRRHAWAQAGWLLGRVLYRDDSRAVAVVALPALRRIAAAVRGGPGEAGTVFTLAWALQVVDASAAEAQLRELAERARAAEDDRTVSVALGELVKLCLGSGRLGEALELAEQKIAASRRAGWGPWTLLADEGRRVQVLAAMGKSEQALAEVERLWEQMAALPARAGADEVVEAWNVRELLLSVGRDAAARLGAWERALAFSDEMLASMRARGAAGTEMARSRFNDYFPLLRLDRIEQAWQLLAGCREVFERHQDGQGLGKVLSALADVEDARGHGDRAIGLERDALRYKYAARDVAALAVSHHNLGNYLTWQAGQVAAGLAHHLAAALVCAVIGGEGLEDSLWAAEHDLRQLPDPAQVPADVAALCRLVEEVPGVRLADLLAALADPGTLRHTYDQIIEAVTTAAGSPG